MKRVIQKILKHKLSWMSDTGPDVDIAVSSRIRLARNLANTPFPTSASPEALDAVRARVRAVAEKIKPFGDGMMVIDMDTLALADRQVLFERRLISADFLEQPHPGTLLLSSDEAGAVMINEEDHLRMQFLRPGFQLETVWTQIDQLDTRLGQELDFAYDSRFGFLTSCPTNVGTGMRASVMLHLPGLVLSGQIVKVIQGVNKLGLTVRGIFGEGTDHWGNLFQVSNQSTLGESEAQIISRMTLLIRQLIGHEKNARAYLAEKDHYSLLDQVGRAYGLLRHAYKLNSEETLNSLSWVRLGVDMGMFSAVDVHSVNDLMLRTLPAHLQHSAGHELCDVERDIYRAAFVRERLKHSGEGVL